MIARRFSQQRRAPPTCWHAPPAPSFSAANHCLCWSRIAGSYDGAALAPGLVGARTARRRERHEPLVRARCPAAWPAEGARPQPQPQPQPQPPRDEQPLARRSMLRVPRTSAANFATRRRTIVTWAVSALRCRPSTRCTPTPHCLVCIMLPRPRTSMMCRHDPPAVDCASTAGRPARLPRGAGPGVAYLARPDALPDTLCVAHAFSVGTSVRDDPLLLQGAQQCRCRPI